MPFKSINELPDNLKAILPTHAQEIYKEAFNSAYDEYKKSDHRRGDNDREGVSHRVAWSAVKHKYQKGPDDIWHSIE